jgi:Fe2+ transport system protein FeoA
MLSRLFGQIRLPRAAPLRPAECALDACASGCRAAVLHLTCAGEEAIRLREMGVHEGACVTVVDSRNGMLLEVKGTRLALGAGLASLIRVLPLGGR